MENRQFHSKQYQRTNLGSCSITSERPNANKVLQLTSYFMRLLRGRCAPIFAQNAHKISRR